MTDPWEGPWVVYVYPTFGWWISMGKLGKYVYNVSMDPMGFFNQPFGCRCWKLGLIF